MSLINEIATRERPFDFYGGGAGRKKYIGQVKFYRACCIIYKWSLPKRDLIACFHSDVNVTFVFSNNLCLKYGCLFLFKNKQYQSI